MKKLLNICIFFLFGFVFLSQKNVVEAASSCTSFIDNIAIEGTIIGKEFDANNSDNTIDFSVRNLANSGYTFNFYNRSSTIGSENSRHSQEFLGVGGKVDVLVDDPSVFETGDWLIRMQGDGIPWHQDMVGGCDLAEYTVKTGFSCKDITISQERNGNICYADSANGGCIDVTSDVNAKVTIVSSITNQPVKGVRIIQDLKQTGGVEGSEQGNTNENGDVAANHGTLASGVYTIQFKLDETGANHIICQKSFLVDLSCSNEDGVDQCSEPPEGGEEGSENGEKTPYSLCAQIPASMDAQRNACLQCTTGSIDEGEGREGVWTAVGCINKDPQSIMQRVISIGIGMSGGVALLTFLAAGFIFSTSQGDPKAYEKAKDMMTASIVGILFVIFSVTILQFIGFSILKIPGFGGS